MKLLRMAVLLFEPAPADDWRKWRIKADGTEVATMGAKALEDGGLLLTVVAATDLSERPEINEEGFIVVPEGPLKQTEAIIELSANMIAVSERCKRSISSTMPSIAFLPENQEIREWLDSTNGILHRKSGVVDPTGYHIDPDTIQKVASDRPDGFALLAEALAHTHPTGVFHELVRFFERAFGVGPYKLVRPLAEFLAGANGMGYTEAEVEHWLQVLRHPATHADRRLEFVLESDILPVVPRMTQAAYDVLFNKVSWRTQSTQRREEWRPPVGTTVESPDFYITPGEGV